MVRLALRNYQIKNHLYHFDFYECNFGINNNQQTGENQIKALILQ